MTDHDTHQPIRVQQVREADAVQWDGGKIHTSEFDVPAVHDGHQTVMVCSISPNQFINKGNWIITHADGTVEVLTDEQCRQQWTPVDATDTHGGRDGL